jgi:hypothetical protein
LGGASAPIRLQLQQAQLVLKNLRDSGLESTGSLALDRLLGLEPLVPRKIDTLPVKGFFDERIPFRQISRYESQGDQSQEAAVRLAFDEARALFIEGPPGTGKTTVIAEIVRQAVTRQMKVLLVSQMHQAVDHALSIFMNDETVPVLRLGNDATKFDYGTNKFWPGNKESGLKQEALEEFGQRLSRRNGYVLAATNMGIATDWALNTHLRHLAQEGFDLVIMDESSREVLSGALVPLRYLRPSGKAIFVGDSKQLPPFGLLGEERRYLTERGVLAEDTYAYNEGVFDWLLGYGRGERVMLSTNYRSHPLIARLISLLFYEGDIQCRGWEDFDAETLSLRLIDISERPGEYYEERAGTSFCNRRSASIVLKLVELYSRRGIPLEQITIITPYLAQVGLIEQLLGERYRGVNLPLVTTIDSYQGGENEAIIFDFVRSNHQGQIGFVKDLRRLNVGWSRAHANLALVWDARTFTANQAPQDSAEDTEARILFAKMDEYYGAQVRIFFPEPTKL